MEPKRQTLLRKMRKEKGFSLKDLQNICGIHANDICRMEYGHIACGELNARRFASALGGSWKDYIMEAWHVESEA